MVKSYVKKPVIIQAIQWTGDNTGEVLLFCAGAARLRKMEDGLSCTIVIETLESNKEVGTRHAASKGDFIIKGIKGEFYPCKPDIFNDCYDILNAPASDKAEDKI